jgi:hypothetical protein
VLTEIAYEKDGKQIGHRCLAHFQSGRCLLQKKGRWELPELF